MQRRPVALCDISEQRVSVANDSHLLIGKTRHILQYYSILDSIESSFIERNINRNEGSWLNTAFYCLAVWFRC